MFIVYHLSYSIFFTEGDAAQKTFDIYQMRGNAHTEIRETLISFSVCAVVQRELRSHS